jgi:hypothetical protein
MVRRRSTVRFRKGSQGIGLSGVEDFRLGVQGSKSGVIVSGGENVHDHVWCGVVCAVGGPPQARLNPIAAAVIMAAITGIASGATPVVMAREGSDPHAVLAPHRE